jgi:hypothetical protein
VSVSTTLNVIVTFQGKEQYFGITVEPASCIGIAVASSSVAVNAQMRCVVVLNGAGSPAGEVWSLSSSSPSLTVPATCKIAPNAKYCYFWVTGVAVSSAPITVTAKYNGQVVKAQIKVIPAG